MSELRVWAPDGMPEVRPGDDLIGLVVDLLVADDRPLVDGDVLVLTSKVVSKAEGRVVARYLDVNPNGSRRDIAGISNAAGNVVGLMPHPERASHALLGSDDGVVLLESLLAAAGARAAARI